jgi:hypothetical protein
MNELQANGRYADILAFPAGVQIKYISVNENTLKCV